MISNIFIIGFTDMCKSVNLESINMINILDE